MNVINKLLDGNMPPARERKVVIKALEKEARKIGVSPSEVIRQLVRKFLKSRGHNFD
jgi:hypothetical protein